MAKQRLEALDGMRGVAALGVVFFHTAQLSKVQILPGAFLSVDLFFVLSGFVIALSYERRLRDGLSLGRFVRARARRLLPTHFIAMFVVTCSIVMVWLRGEVPIWRSLNDLLTSAMLNALFIPDWRIATGDAFVMNPALWSLWAEWIVSLLYGSLLFGMRTRTIAAVSTLSFLVVGIVAFRVPQGWMVGIAQTDVFLGAFRGLGGFAAGVVIWRMHEKGWGSRLPAVRPVAVYAIWTVMCLSPLIARVPALQCAMAIIVAPLLVALLVRAERPVSGILRWLGTVSYPLYASHYAVMIALGFAVKHFGSAPTVWYAIPMTATALGLAWVVKTSSEIRLGPIVAAGIGKGYFDPH